MNPDKLLDAIGMLDDHHFEAEKKARMIPWRKRLIGLLAAVLIIALSVGTAIAVSPELRELIVSILYIETPERPLTGNPDAPTDPTQPLPALQKIDIVDIDGQVKAYYYSSSGVVMPTEGGFFTCEWRDDHAAPESPAFWEITENGIVETEAKRIDIPLTVGDKSFRIIFDYGVLQGKLCVHPWPEDLDQNPYGNGWNATAIHGRTDVVLLTIPVLKGEDYTTEYFLLDLTTQQTTELLAGIPRENLWIYFGVFSSDAHYAIFDGWDGKDHYGYWFCNLEAKTLTELGPMLQADIRDGQWPSPVFLDDETLLCCVWRGNDTYDLVRFHLPTGAGFTLEENIPIGGFQFLTSRCWPNTYGLRMTTEGEYELINFRNNSRLQLAGLPKGTLNFSQSPDGQKVFVGLFESGNYSRIGLLEPATGVLNMLNRKVCAEYEHFMGWLDTDTIALTAQADDGSYYAYVYKFREHSAESTDSAETQPSETESTQPTEIVPLQSSFPW